MRRKNTVDIIGSESACGNKKERGGDKREDNKDSHEFGPELVAQDFIASLQIKPEDVFSYKKNQCEKRNDIDCEQADKKKTCSDINGRHLNIIKFNNRYCRNKQHQPGNSYQMSQYFHNNFR